MHHVLLSPIAHALALLQHPHHNTWPQTFPLRRYSQKAFHTALSLKLLLVLRVQVRSEAIAPILGGDNASSMLHLRPGAACFAAPEVLTVLRPTRACVVGLLPMFQARVRTSERLYSSLHVMDCGHVHADIVYILCIFSESSLENRANVGP